MHTQRPRLRLALVTLLALASLGALAVVRPPLTATIWTRGDDLALTVAWMVALVASAWLFVATGVCVLALQLARPRLAHRLLPALPLGIRRLVEVAIVASCAALPALPAHAAGAPPSTPAIVRDVPVVRTADTPSPPAPLPTPAPAPVPAPRPAPVPPAVPRRAVVRAGDNLWLIARAALARGSTSQPTEPEVARYWRAVIAANRSTLRSGDPSLIFPGEIVTLPPTATVS